MTQYIKGLYMCQDRLSVVGNPTNLPSVLLRNTSCSKIFIMVTQFTNKKMRVLNNDITLPTVNSKIYSVNAWAKIVMEK